MKKSKRQLQSIRQNKASIEIKLGSFFIWGALFLIALATLMAYSNSCSGAFIFDDVSIITGNPTIQNLWSKTLSKDASIGLHSGLLHVISTRPVTNWTFGLNYALGGFNVFGYHLFNVLMHLGSAFFIFGIIRRTLLSERLQGYWGKHAIVLAFSIALLWATHPIETSAINYITQRLESLASFFYLATLYFFICATQSKWSWVWLCLSLLAVFLGMGSKEIVVTAPVVILLYDRTFISGSFKKALLDRSEFYFGLVLAWGYLLALLISGNSGSIGDNGRGVTSDRWSYAATQLGVVLHYLKLVLWPSPLIFDTCWPVANTLSSILLPGTVILAMGAFTLWGLIRNEPWAFVAACFFIILSPSSSFVPIVDEYVNEYRMYLPLLAPIVLLVMGAYAGLEYVFTKINRNNLDGLGKKIYFLFLPCVLGIAIAFSWLTYQRNFDYTSNLTIWSDSVNKSPENARARNNYGVFLKENKQNDAAIEQYRKAIELNPVYADAYLNLGTALIAKGDSKEAVQAYRKVISLRPNLFEGHLNLAVVLHENKEYREAVHEFKKALQLRPNDSTVSHDLQVSLTQLAVEQFKAGNKAAAIEATKETLSINPNNETAKSNLLKLTKK